MKGREDEGLDRGGGRIRKGIHTRVHDDGEWARKSAPSSINGARANYLLV